MRTALATLLVLTATLTASAQQRPGPDRGRTRDDIDQRGLTAEQIGRYAQVYYPGIRSCYFTHAQRSRTATGELSITIVIHRDGSVFDMSVNAPGVRGPQYRRLTACLRDQIDDWHFPMRRDFTTAVLPYYFMRLNLPGTGPQYSCWKPRGCRTQK